MPTEQKITYLFGAGASYNALPLVNEIPQTLQEMKRYIEFYNLEILTQNLNLTRFKADIDIITSHASIDTLARKYWLKNEGTLNNLEYLRIKQIITCLLIYASIEKPILRNYKTIDSIIQIDKKKKYLLDPRYDSFLSSILTIKEKKLPDNISIISWNYDSQLEKANDFYFEYSSLMDTGRAIGFDYVISKSTSNYIKLNGSSFFVDGVNPKAISYKTYDKSLHEIFCKVLGEQVNQDIYPGIKFAWEVNSDLASENRKRAADKIKESEYIVVIGYSFPIFNREVDIEIFKEFKGKKIYIQDTPERVEQIKNQLESIRTGLSKKCETQTNLDQFLIPNEYWIVPPKMGTRAFIY